MKNLRFQSLLLLSKKERASRKISFDPRTTLILGENDTGKSSLIKAIYATFGADPAVIHPNWKSLGVASVIDFEVDDVSYGSCGRRIFLHFSLGMAQSSGVGLASHLT